MKFLNLKTITKPTAIALGLGLFSLCFSYNTHAQKFHKWVDSNGSTHYTLTPPPHNAKRLGDVVTYNDRSSQSSSPLNEAEQAAASSNTQQENQTNQEKSLVESNERIPLPNQQNN